MLASMALHPKALPKALRHRGHRVMVVMPRYENYEGAFDTAVRVRFNIMGEDTEVGYFHMHKDGIDTDSLSYKFNNILQMFRVQFAVEIRVQAEVLKIQE